MTIGVARLRVALLLSLAPALACCTAARHKTEGEKVDCARPPTGFYRTNDETFWARHPSGITGPIFNVITVDKDATIRWNGIRIDHKTLDTYLGEVSQMEPVPYTTVDFAAGTLCGPIRLVRFLMNRHLACASADQGEHCLQGGWPSIPPP